MIEPAAAMNLIASFPAAGAGGSTLDLLEKFAVRRGLAYRGLPNPASVEDLVSGRWEVESIDAIRSAAEDASAQRVVLVGHSMGGFSAIRLFEGLSSGLALPVGLLIVNTPCPDSAGRIPTLSDCSDADIARLLAHDGFPQELLDDEEMLAEVADGLRADAMIADLLAEWVASAGGLKALHAVSTRGDMFIPPELGCAWQSRVAGEFHWTVGPGSHALDEGSIDVLERAIDSVMASVRAEVA